MDYPNWFEQTAQHNFEKFLTPLAGKDNLNFLQLGVYTGDASVWLCENILTSKVGTNLYDVDTWLGSDEEAHKEMDFVGVYDTYRRKTDHFGFIMRFTGTTVEFLKRDYKFEFDFIYIDADHTTVGVLLDAELSWGLLKSGGIMAFDDYTWGEGMSPELTPTLGIDLFLSRHEGEYETLVVNAQYWIKKI